MITENGTYEDLLAHDGPFAQFLQTYLTQEDEENEDDDESKFLWIIIQINILVFNTTQKNKYYHAVYKTDLINLPI